MGEEMVKKIIEEGYIYEEKEMMAEDETKEKGTVKVEVVWNGKNRFGGEEDDVDGGEEVEEGVEGKRKEVIQEIEKMYMRLYKEKEPTEGGRPREDEAMENCIKCGREKNSLSVLLRRKRMGRGGKGEEEEVVGAMTIRSVGGEPGRRLLVVLNCAVEEKGGGKRARSGGRSIEIWRMLLNSTRKWHKGAQGMEKEAEKDVHTYMLMPKEDAVLSGEEMESIGMKVWTDREYVCDEGVREWIEARSEIGEWTMWTQSGRY